MADWSEKWSQDRPRWGTYSVKAHDELERLIPDLLMYDVLVFPSPDSDAEYARWEREGWNPSLLARRVTQLGDHAVVCPWDQALREGWEQDWWRLPKGVRDTPEAEFSLTAAVMAEQSLVKLMGVEDDRFGQTVLDQPRVHPAFEGAEAWTRMRKETLEVVPVFRTDSDAEAITGAGVWQNLGSDASSREGPQDGIRLHLRLANPESADEKTLHRALDLVEDDDFQSARRRLWSWEKTLPIQEKLDTRELMAGLDALVADYNDVVRRQKWSTVTTGMFLIVPALTGVAIDAATGGGWTGAIAGVGSSVAFDRVKARFPKLVGAAARVSHHPGSAVEGMLAIAGVARPNGL